MTHAERKRSFRREDQYDCGDKYDATYFHGLTRRHCHIIGNCMRWTFHFPISRRIDGGTPHLQPRCPEGSLRSCRGEITLDVVGDVGGLAACVLREKPLRGSTLLNPGVFLRILHLIVASRCQAVRGFGLHLPRSAGILGPMCFTPWHTVS